MKAMKKIVSLLMVVVMAMSLSLTAFAAEPNAAPRAALSNGTIKVTGANLKDKAVTVVRLFTANVEDKNSDGMIDEGDNVAYEMESAWQIFFNEQVTTKKDTNATSEEAYEYVKNLTPEEKLITFAKAAKDHYNAHAAEFASIAITKTGDSTNTATFTGLPTGYYLVLPAGGSTGVDRATDAMIVNVPGAKATELQLKTEYPTVDKTTSNATTVGGNNHADSAQIGDKVNFVLTAKVPNMAEYTNYTFKFKDTLSQGLTLNQDGIKVTIGGKTLTNPADYTVDVDTTSNQPKTMLTITMVNLKQYVVQNSIAAGTDMKVEYSATLNKDAAIGNAGNANQAELEYSNKPGTNETGTSEPSITKTYTFEMKVHKHASGSEAFLPGAEFELKGDKDTVIKLYKESETVYRVATQKEITDGNNVVTSFVTVDSSAITIKGLKEGTYNLVEKTAPTGYNKLTKPVVIEIKPTYGEDGSLTKVEYVVNGGQASTEATIKVENKTGAFLPETGSIGTIGLTILGVALVIGGLGFTSRKKKEQN